MNAKVMVALAGVCAGSGCVVTSESTVAAGDPLDAHFELTWTTHDVRSGAEIDCHSTGADTVRVRSRNVLTGDELVDLFDCDAKSGETSELSAGEYSVSVDLVGCGGDPACAQPRLISALSNRSLYRVWADDDVDLGQFVFLAD